MRFSPAVLASLSALWGCGGTTSCFAAGTRVSTPRGPVRIEDLAVGDTVWAWSTERNEAVERRITAVHRSVADQLLAVRFGELVLRVTPSHPVWDAAAADWRPAGLLEGAVALAWFPGAESKQIPWSGSTALPGEPVWNLTVEGEQTFFAEGVLVHNKSIASPTLYDHFPFDGDRTWTYRSHDPAVDHELVLTSLQADRTEVDGQSVYRIDARTRCVGAATGCTDDVLVRSWSMASTVTEGVGVFEVATATGQAVFDPPVLLAPDDMLEGVAASSEVRGTTWESTLVGYAACTDVVFVPGQGMDAANCAAHLVVTQDGADPLNEEVAGEYWAARGVGLVGFALDADGGALWGLSAFDCSPDADCDGSW